MPDVRNIPPKKDRNTGAGTEVGSFTHNMGEFFGNHFPHGWMEGFLEPHSWNRAWRPDLGQTFEVWPKVDIIEKVDALVVRAEMPGVKKEDLAVTIAGDRLTFEAKRNFEEKEEKEELFRSEIAYGRLFRAVNLPVAVLGDKAKAELKDGVVEVYLPKVEAITPHSVKVA